MLSLKKKLTEKLRHNKTSCKLIALLLCMVMMLPLSGCGEDKTARKQIFAMDTVMTLTAYGRKGETGLEAAEKIINNMDTMLDPENNSSAVYALNKSQGQSTSVPDQIAEMLETAKTVYDRSNGALDLTIYPLVKLWGFIDEQYYVPTEDEITEELKKLCFDDVTILEDSENNSFSVTMPEEAQISFGAVAKGCASDYTIAAMKSAGIKSGIISLGGNVQTLGLKPDGSNWNVAIQDPDDTGSYVGILSVGETAVITSGDYERFFERDGVIYHHIIDPATGAPARSGLRSVSIVCESGTMADCLSTALFVLGEEKALDYWRTYGGFEMILISNDNRIVCTDGLNGSFTLSNNNYTVTYTK